MPEVERHAAYLPVSQELMSDAAEVAEFREALAAALRGDLPPTPPRPDPPTPAGHAALLEATGPILRAVAELHAPEPYPPHPHVCRGCDADGYEWEPPRWPCRTVELIAEQLGVDLREADDA